MLTKLRTALRALRTPVPQPPAETLDLQVVSIPGGAGLLFDLADGRQLVFVMPRAQAGRLAEAIIDAAQVPDEETAQ